MGIDRTLAVLAAPTRRALLSRAARSPERAGALARGFRMSSPAVSKHLRVLREAGLVVAQRRGRERCYRPSPHGLADVQKCMERIARLWDVSRQCILAERPRAGVSALTPPAGAPGPRPRRR